jgi:predicted DNA-binding helix-hairpin-helix protein
MNTEQKLSVLADSGKYDLACSCKYDYEPGRVRGDAGKWIYPSALPNGRKMHLLKTLLSNECVNDCTYCPFNCVSNTQRCTLEPEELAAMFSRLKSARLVDGLFVSSGVCGSTENTMAKIIAVAEILRKKQNFRGFIHLKIVPGASDEAVRQAVMLASRVSVNIEAPGPERLAKLSRRKDFHNDIIRTMRKINEYKQFKKGSRGQTTQFVVGAAGESDREIVVATHRLYNGYDMERVYYSAFQNTASDEPAGDEGFVREHRLYQVDYLLRKYNFDKNDILFDPEGRLDLNRDPKQVWADSHPEFFPVNINRAGRYELLRVPGIGPVGASRIINRRRNGGITDVSELAAMRVRHRLAGSYIVF